MATGRGGRWTFRFDLSHFSIGTKNGILRTFRLLSSENPRKSSCIKNGCSPYRRMLNGILMSLTVKTDKDTDSVCVRILRLEWLEESWPRIPDARWKFWRRGFYARRDLRRWRGEKGRIEAWRGRGGRGKGKKLKKKLRRKMVRQKWWRFMAAFVSVKENKWVRARVISPKEERKTQQQLTIWKDVLSVSKIRIFTRGEDDGVKGWRVAGSWQWGSKFDFAAADTQRVPLFFLRPFRFYSRNRSRNLL